MKSEKNVSSETSAIDFDALAKVIRPGDTLERDGKPEYVTIKTFLHTGSAHNIELKLSGGGVLKSTDNIQFDKVLELIHVNDVLHNYGGIFTVAKKTFRGSASVYQIELTVDKVEHSHPAGAPTTH